MILFHSCEYDNYLQYPRMKRLRHANVVEQVKHFRGCILAFDSMLAHVHYGEPGNMESRYLRWETEIINFPGLPQGERVFRANFKAPSSDALLPLEQKIFFEM